MEATKPPGVSDNFFKRASETILNLSSTDNQLMTFLQTFYSSNDFSDGNLQAINMLMNMRSQRSQLISNLEEKRHNGAMSIISNLK